MSELPINSLKIETGSEIGDFANKKKMGDVYKVATKSFTKMLGRVSHNVNQAKETLSSATSTVTEVRKDYITSKKMNNVRDQRREQGKVAIQDAMLNIRGTFSAFQAIETKWYLAVYPKNYNTEHNALTHDADDIDDVWDDIHHTPLEMLPENGVPNSFTDYEKLVHWKKTSSAPVTGRQGEHARSVYMYPFSTESFLDLSFYVHLTDLYRYRSVEFCIYIEGPHDAEPILPKSVVLNSEFGLPLERTDLGYVPHATEKKKSLQQVINSYMKKSKYIPGFYAEMSLRRGSIFSPCGGRLHLSLKSNSPMLLNLPEGHKLAALDGLDILVTVMPIAQPSTLYLRTFKSVDSEAPCYPSYLLDCINLQTIPVQWDQLSTGRATCSGQYRNKVFIGSLNRGPKKTECVLYEFTKFGKRVGKVFVRDGNERVIFLFSGHIHVVCCFNNGMIGIVYEKTLLSDAKTRDRSDGTHDTLFKRQNSITLDGTNPDATTSSWEEPLYLQTHPEGTKLISGCMVHHANMDISFIVDHLNGISVHILDKGLSIRTAYNEGFLSSEIKQLCCYGQRLYLAHSDGKITIININLILNGELEYITQLSRLIVMHETVITTGISSIAVFSSNGFLGMKNDDEVVKKTKPIRDMMSVTDNIKFDTIEGHMLLVGGSDEDPSVRLLKPELTGMKEVVCLRGHTRAITDVFVDAAGRFFITSSKGDKSILIWDGLTFNCEKQITDVSIGSIHIGDNLIVVSSISNPFVRFWGLPPQLLKTQKQRDAKIDEDHNPEYIVTTRNPFFCQAMLKGNVLAPNETLSRVRGDLDSNYDQVLHRWNRQYKRFAKPLIPLQMVSSIVSPLTPSRAKARRQHMDRIESNNDIECSSKRNVFASDKYDIVENVKSKTDASGSSSKKITFRDDISETTDDASHPDMATLLSNLLLDGKLENIAAYSEKMKAKKRNHRHISNRIFKNDTRAHFSDSDDDWDDYESSDDDESGHTAKPKIVKTNTKTVYNKNLYESNRNTKEVIDSVDTSDTAPVNNSYLPVIYTIKNVYEED